MSTWEGLGFLEGCDLGLWQRRRHWAANILVCWELVASGAAGSVISMTLHQYMPLFLGGIFWASENRCLLYFKVFKLFTQMMSYMVFMITLWSKPVRSIYPFIALHVCMYVCIYLLSIYLLNHAQSSQPVSEFWPLTLRFLFYSARPEYGTCSSKLNCF